MESSTAAPSRTTTGSSTIADMLALAAERYGDRPAVRFKREGAWHDVSFAEVGEIVSELARGLIDLGLQPGDRVSLLCTTRPEWTYADFAITSAGGVVVPSYAVATWRRSATCSEMFARNSVLSIRPWKIGTPNSMHFSMTSRRSIPASRASSVGVRWIAIVL